jgi:hypothetical protein
MPSKFPPPLPVVLPDVPRRPNYAVRKRDEQIRRLSRKMRQLAPHLDDPRYGPALRAFSMSYLLLERAYRRVKQIPDEAIVRDGAVVPAIETVTRMAGKVMGQAASLGLTPSSAASIAKPVDTLVTEALERAGKIMEAPDDETPTDSE